MNTLLSIVLSTVATSDVGNLLWLFVGVVVVLGIVFFIMRQVAAPAIAYTVLYIVIGIALLMLAMNFFFGMPSRL